jgi:hypothetical protein
MNQPAIVLTGIGCGAEAFPGRSILSKVSRIMKGMLLLPLLLFFAVPAAQGQLTTADILGTVTDTSGAVIPNAVVVLRSAATNETRNATSDASGNYTFSLLQPGRYSVKVTAPGFKASSTPDIAVESGDRARADVHLQVGAASETITVEAQTPLLQADNATVSSTVGQEEVQDLPLIERNFVQLVAIVPGANEGPGNGLTSGNRPDDRRGTAAFSVNGQDDTLNNYVIDGIDNNERIIGTIGIRPNVEGIQEITVETNSYAPEIGRTAGGVVNVVTKSGSNNFHGSVYEYFRNDKTDSYTHFANPNEPKPEMRHNQYGVSIGGPVFKNKTFFYGDWEGLRDVIGGTTYQESVPTLAQYDAIHSLNGLTPQTLVNAGVGTAGYPIDKVALNYLMLYPAPNSGSAGSSVNNFVNNPSKTQFSNTFDARIDHNFNPNNLIMARYGYNNVKTNTPAALPVALTTGPLAGITAGGGRWNFSGPATDQAQQAELSFTHLFNQNLILELKTGYTYINNLSAPLDYGIGADNKVGFGPNMTFNGATDGLTVTSFSGLSDDGDGQYVPLNDADNTFQYMGTVSWIRGNHNIKMGASLIRRQARNLQSAAGFGTISNGLKSDNVPGNPQLSEANGLASALVGAYSSASRNYDLATPNYRAWEPSFFAQDSWRVSHNLTVIYGARYEIFTPFTEAHNNLSTYDMAAARVAAASNNVAGAQNALLVAGQNGVSATAGIETFHGSIAPRIGFAYTFREGTVLRGGYGLSYFPGNYTSNAALKNAPFTSNYAPSCESLIANQIENANGFPNGAFPACGVSAGPGAPAPGQNFSGTPGYDTLDAGLPLPVPQTINSGGLSLIAEDPKDRPAIVSQFNLQIEHQFGANVLTVGYVGNLGQHLPEIINDVNIPVSGPATTALVTNWGTVGNARPLIHVLPNLGGVGYVQSEGISNYNGLQVSLDRRLSKGLSFGANYTWSHDLDDVIGFSEEGDQGAFNADPTKIRQIDYGTGENSIKSRFAMGLTYKIPTIQALNTIGKDLLGGWEVSTLTALQTGKPITVENSWNNGMAEVSLGYMYGGNADRPNQIAKATLSKANRSNAKWFNTAAFQVQPIGTVGNDPRNNITGPRFGHADLSLSKDFRVTEAVKAQFRAQAFNFTNQTSYYMADTNDGNSAMGSATFGQITETDPNYNPRQFLFALKVLF